MWAGHTPVAENEVEKGQGVAVVQQPVELNEVQPVHQQQYEQQQYQPTSQI